jgi:hypothetical protein
MKLLKILLFIGAGYSLTFSTCKCGDLKSVSLPEYTFFIQNNSNDTFRYSYSTFFPDTSIQNNLDSSLIYPLKQQQIDIPVYLLPNFKTEGLLEFFLFNVDTLRKYGWQKVASKYLITKRYDLTYDSIKENNNVIDYP